MTSYVSGLRYIDDLVLHEKGEERLYSLADPNWNVVALVDATGAVVERMKYDASGKVNGLTSDWNRTFTGQVLDNETGLLLYRNRIYHSTLGRFVSRDPIGYDGMDINIYKLLEIPRSIKLIQMDFVGHLLNNLYTKNTHLECR